MENNNKATHIINTTIKYRLNQEVIKCRVFDAGDKKHGVEVEQIFGMKVSWFLTHFRSVDIYEYAETQIFNDIENKLFDYEAAKAYTNQSNFIDLISNEVCDEIKLQLMDFALALNIDWKTLTKIMSRFGEVGYLSKYLYSRIGIGYFENVIGAYFTINLDSVKYVTLENGVGQTRISFLDGNNIVVSKDFFIDHHFYNELARSTVTEDFLSDIRADVRSLLCNQKTI